MMRVFKGASHIFLMRLKNLDEKELIFEADIKIAYLVDKKPAAMSSKMIEFFKNYK